MEKNKEHIYKKFFKLLKENDLSSVILLCGKEQFLIDWAYDELVKANVDKSAKAMDLTVFDSKGLDFSEVLAAVETFPIASPKKVVVLSEFTVLEDESPPKFSANDEKIFLEIMENIPKETMLIIKSNKVDKRKKLYKAIEKNGKIFEFDSLDEDDLRAFIVKHFGIYGKKIELAAKEWIVKNSGYFNKESDYSLQNLENDIRKISAYSDGDTVITGDVLDILSENIDTYIFSMLDNMEHGNFGNAIKIIHKILNNKNSGKSKDRNIEFKIISTLISQYELMLKIADMKKEGFNNDMIANALKEHSFRVKKAAEFASKYTKDGIIKQLIFLYNMDKAIKDGSMAAVLLFELFISMSDLLSERKGKAC